MKNWKKIIFPTPPGYTDEENDEMIYAFFKIAQLALAFMVCMMIGGMLGM